MKMAGIVNSWLKQVHMKSPDSAEIYILNSTCKRVKLQTGDQTLLFETSNTTMIIEKTDYNQQNIPNTTFKSNIREDDN